MTSVIENPNMQMHNPGRKKADMIPNIYISSENWAELQDEISESKITIKVDIEEALSSDNVLGYIEGTDLKAELVIITAHYDHLGYDNGEVCNGADDDGSGTVSVIELAEAFQKVRRRWLRSAAHRGIHGCCENRSRHHRCADQRRRY